MSIDYENLLSSFVAESQEMLDKAEDAILRLEQGFDKALVNDVFRAFHTIKGDSGIFGLQKITDLSHALESVLDRIRAGTMQVSMERIDLLLTGVDHLRQLIGDTAHCDQVPIGPLLARLAGALDATAPGAPEETPAVLPQTIVKQEPAAAGSGQFAFKIPARLKETAEADGAALTIVYVDLYRQHRQSLLEIRELLEGLEDEGSLLMQGVLAHRLPGIGKATDALLPYYLVLKTGEPVTDFLARHAIQGRVLKTIVQLRGAPVPSAAPLPTQAVSTPAAPAPSAAAAAGPPATSATSATPAAPAAPATEDETTMPSGAIPPYMIVKPVKRRPAAGPPVEAAPAEASATDAAALAQFKDAPAETHLRVHIDLLDELINLAGETIIARNDLVQKVERLRDPSLTVTSKKVSYLVTKLQESIMRTRLQSINTIFQRLPRLVRDLSLATGKKVDLVTDGGDVELDKTLIDAIVDPVMHMVRNAVDHGIERPETRLAAGKRDAGTLRLAASLRGGNVVLEIIDDGKGLSRERILQVAVQKGLVNERRGEEMTDDEVYELIFEPGFSTAETVTQTSGRGVGMDVVRTNFKRVGGSVEVRSVPGRGTTITATLPQTLSIITCLMVKVRQRLYALPQQNIDELVLVEPAQLARVEDKLVYQLRGRLIPLVHAGDLMEGPLAGEAPPRYVAVVRSDRHHFGLLIDAIINPEEIVVKPLGEHFSGLALFSGAAIMGDGEAVLIMDVSGVARFANLQPNLRDEAEDNSLAAADLRGSLEGYLLIGVAGERFAVPVRSVPRIERLAASAIGEFMGAETFVFNDEIVPLVRLESLYGLPPAPGSDLFVLVFNVHEMRVGIVAHAIHSVVDSMPNIETGVFLGEAILGQALVGGIPTKVLDVVGLIERLQQDQYRELRSYILDKRGGAAAVGASGSLEGVTA